MTYMDFVKQIILSKQEGEPIYIEDIANELSKQFNLDLKKSSAAASVATKRILEKNEIPNLRFFQKGIYYRCTKTPFGETDIDKQRLISDKYLAYHSGYESGDRFLYLLGLTSQLPNAVYLVSNYARDCTRYDEKLEVYTCPPKTEVNEDNKLYLQILDALSMFDKSPIDAERPYKIIDDYIRENHLQYDKLLYYADRFYSKKTVLHLAHSAGQRESLL